MFTPPINNPTFNIPPGIISPALELILRNVYSNVQWPASLGEVRTQFTVPRPGFLLGTSTAEIGGKERTVAAEEFSELSGGQYQSDEPYSRLLLNRSPIFSETFNDQAALLSRFNRAAAGLEGSIGRAAGSLSDAFHRALGLATPTRRSGTLDPNQAMTPQQKMILMQTIAKPSNINAQTL